MHVTSGSTVGRGHMATGEGLCDTLLRQPLLPRECLLVSLWVRGFLFYSVGPLWALKDHLDRDTHAGACPSRSSSESPPTRPAFPAPLAALPAFFFLILTQGQFSIFV